MSTLNKSALAIAVVTALSSYTVTAATYNQYNFENKPPLQSQYPDFKNKQARKSTHNVVTWLVKLHTPSIAEQSLAGINFKNATSSIQQAQQSVEAAIANTSPTLQVVAKTSKLSNAIIVNGEEAEVNKLLHNPLVHSVLPVYDYKLNVADSADYIKATPLVSTGEVTGEGVRVAVLDTGIDYTHQAFGGAGTVEAYEAAASNPADTPLGHKA